MFRTIKVKLYPNNNQQIYINQLFGCYRFVYNKCLYKKKEAYLENKSILGLKELTYYFHNELTKSEEYSFLNLHNTKVLKNSILIILDSYKRFFVNGHGFPKFKSKHNNKQSCLFPFEAISSKNNFLTGKLTLTKQLKDLKFKTSDEYKIFLDKNKKNIRSATLSKTKSGNYFLSILIDGQIEKELPKTKNIIGIDLGIKEFIVTSDNQKFENIKIKRNNEKILIKLNRQLSKKVNGSRNKEKARIKLAKYHEHLNNIKENYLHQVSNQLLNENQIIAMENLNINGMLKNHKLARSIQELSLNHFKSMLIYKAEWFNRYIVEVDQFYPSSKLCNVCGYKNDDLTLKDRKWVCPVCGTNHNRDLNAAINIKKEGLKILIGHRLPEFTLADNHILD